MAIRRGCNIKVIATIRMVPKNMENEVMLIRKLCDGLEGLIDAVIFQPRSAIITFRASRYAGKLKGANLSAAEIKKVAKYVQRNHLLISTEVLTDIHRISESLALGKDNLEVSDDLYVIMATSRFECQTRALRSGWIGEGLGRDRD